MATLAALHHGFVTAGWMGMLGIVASLPDWVDPDALAPLLDIILGALSLVLVVATGTAIMETLQERAAQARSVRTWTLVVTAVMVLVLLAAIASLEVGPVFVVVGLVGPGASGAVLP